jgi:DNA polymerase-1
LEHRELSKLKGTYVDALPDLVNPEDGRLHTSFNQAGAVTGRLSSSNPNLQNIPIRTELGRRVRRAFIAPKGSVLLSADYSQVELRILAHASQDENMLKAFADGEDIHASTAATLFNVPIEQVTKDMRRLGKTINFGVVYGISDWGVAGRTELNLEEARKLIQAYNEKYAGVKAYMDRTKAMAHEKGYVQSLLGRRRYFPELGSGRKLPIGVRNQAEREAINMPIQGTAADIIKIAMVRLHAALEDKKLKSKMILQVHDELVLEVPKNEVEQVTKLVHKIMCDAYPLDAPLQVEVGVGPNWLETKPVT